MSRTTAALVLLGLALTLTPFASAQDTKVLYDFQMEAEESTYEIDVGESAVFRFKFRDLSHDSTGGLSPQAPVNVAPSQHQVRFQYRAAQQDFAGWSVILPPTMYITGGQERDLQVVVSASQLVQNPYFPFTLTAIVSASGGPYYAHLNLTALTLGVASFNAQAEDLGGELKPGQIVDAKIRITNGALEPRAFDIEVASNQCGLLVATSNHNLVGPKSTEVYTVSLRAASAKPWYFSEICELGIQVNPSDAPSATRSISVPVIINGGYVNPVWVFWLVFITVAVILLFLFLARRKERIEEELLGKPQKPWTIPVEALYLRVLRQKDERAWYVVRHHLMEEEYQSSLLWYKAYKKATKGTRAKEALVLRQEKKYERWKAKWAKAIAKPSKKADKFEAKLQRKLDRQGRKQDRKDARKVRKITKKMSAAHAKQVEKALEKWQKQSRKATKKGLEAPPRPVLPEPDYPEEPEPRSYVLADHKWAKKAARFRSRRVREQGNLEVKFEKADARHLAKLRRKVQRLARKLDDPDFIAEHPLLRSEA